MIKTLKTFLRRLPTLICVLLLLATQQAAAYTQNDYDCTLAGGTCYYDPSAKCLLEAGEDTANTSSSGSSPNGSGQLDVKDIVESNDGFSASILSADGKPVGGYKADTTTYPASSLKPAIVHAALASGAKLSDKITITQNMVYGQENFGSQITVSEAIKQTLIPSHNTTANALIKAAGGPGKINEKLKGLGYKNTEVNAYYSESSDISSLSSTAEDVGLGMVNIFKGHGAEYSLAQDSLKHSDVNPSWHIQGVARKPGVKDSPDIRSMATLTNKINGKQYVITVYEQGTSREKAGAMHNAIVAKLKSTNPSGQDTEDNAAASVGACACPAPGDTTASNTTGANGPGSGSVYQSGLQPPYILEQWAIHTLKAIAQKKGVDEKNTVTKEHVLALVAFAMGEGGDIANGDLFNPLNTGLNDPELLDGAQNNSGLQSFKSFDAGVEAAARTMVGKNQGRLATVLTKPDSSAKDFMTALTYYQRYKGNMLWAEQSQPPHQGSYYRERLQLVSQVRRDYKDDASLVIGTAAHEQQTGKRDKSKLTFDGSSNLASVSDSPSDTQQCQCPADGGSVDGSGVLVGKTNVEQAFRFFLSHDATPEQAAGIVGNFMVETGANRQDGKLDTSASNGTHEGIGQWDGGRWASLVKFAQGDKFKDKGPRSLITQLEFALQESATKEFLRTKPASAEKAAEVFESLFERSGGSALSERKSNAAWILHQYKDDAAGAGVSAAGSNTDCSSTVSGQGGARIAAVAEQEYKKNGNKRLETCGENCGPEVKKYTGGPTGPNAPWCAWFVSWVYREAGYEFKGAPAGADGNISGVPRLADWFRQHGTYFDSSGSDKPQPGDVIMYNGGHTGIVVKVNGDNIETVEGNTSGDGSFNAEGETVGRKSLNYKTYTSRTLHFGRLKNF